MSDIEALERAVQVLEVAGGNLKDYLDAIGKIKKFITKYKRHVHIPIDKLRHKTTNQSSLDEGLRLHHNAIEVDLAMEVKNDGQ